MTALTKEEAARHLDGSEYGKEGTPELFAAMNAAGLVAVFGASDDLMEFRGAIYDELGAWNGGTGYVTALGITENRCDNDRCPYHADELERAATIEALWEDDAARAGAGKDGPCWTYRTTIPHATFLVTEDGEPYCRGIVFALADAVPAAATRGAGP